MVAASSPTRYPVNILTSPDRSANPGFLQGDGQRAGTRLDVFVFRRCLGVVAQQGDVVFCVVDGDIPRDQPGLLKPPATTKPPYLAVGSRATLL